MPSEPYLYLNFRAKKIKSLDKEKIDEKSVVQNTVKKKKSLNQLNKKNSIGEFSSSEICIAVPAYEKISPVQLLLI